MGWETIIPLLVNYGLPTVKYIIEKFASGQNVTVADIDALIELEKRTARDEMLAVMAAKGMDPNSDAGKAFLALVS